MTTPDTLIATRTERLRRETPGAVAVLLKGSHARGDAGPHSDIDFDVLVEGEPIEDYLAWLVPSDRGGLVHVSVAVQDLAGWLKERNEPEPWAFGLPVRETTRLLWVRDASLRHELDRPWRAHPPQEPELEDFVESFGKVANARRRGDELGVRQAAQSLAGYCPTLLRPVNPSTWATNPRTALDAVLAFAVAPPGYREDMLICLGLSACATGVVDLFEAARRLTLGTLTLTREHAHLIAPLLPNDLATYLRDGVLERYARQIANDPE